MRDARQLLDGLVLEVRVVDHAIEEAEDILPGLGWVLLEHRMDGVVERLGARGASPHEGVAGFLGVEPLGLRSLGPQDAVVVLHRVDDAARLLGSALPALVGSNTGSAQLEYRTRRSVNRKTRGGRPEAFGEVIALGMIGESI